MNRLFSQPTKLIFLGVLALLIAANHAFFFDTPWHERGDFALNALQVERAKHLDEVYGNYSRFHFNHPGPAFFYVYAIGEYVLHDWLKVVPSQHNAHALTGTALQVMFLAVSLGIMAQWVRSRWFLPLALMLAGVHFSLLQHAFTSIWPPHVLLMPFVCFLVAAASTAAGNARHLPVMVLAGSFLVHGHVAQPLIVGLVFFAAYGSFWIGIAPRPSKCGAPWRLHPSAHAVAAACVVVFVLPFVIDLTLGRESNLAQILSFLNAKKDHKTFAEAGAYLLSFFGYFRNIDQLLPEGKPVSLAFVQARAGLYVVWVVLLLASLGGWWALRRRPEHSECARFFSALLLILGTTAVAALIWGRAQTGPMFEFNAFFLHGFTYAFLALFAGVAAAWLPQRGALMGGVLLCALGATAIWRETRPPESTIDANYDLFVITARALQTDPRPGATKLLVFSHNDWGDAAGIALALKRLGRSYRTDEHWRFMFGRYRTLSSNELDSALDNYSLWRLSRHPLPGRSASLDRDLRVYFDPSPLDPNDAVIDCSANGNLERYAVFGLTTPDDTFSWTNTPRAALQLSSPHVTADVPIAITAEPFAPHHLGGQPMILSVNNSQVAEFSLTQAATVRAVISAEIWNRKSIPTLVMYFPKATSPRALDVSADPRILGWGIYRIAFGAAAR